MDLIEDGKNVEEEIDELLKALDGIEQCFVIDEVEIPKESRHNETISSKSMKKRPLGPSLSPILPVKKIGVDPSPWKKGPSIPSPTSSSSRMPYTKTTNDKSKIDACSVTNFNVKIPEAGPPISREKRSLDPSQSASPLQKIRDRDPRLRNEESTIFSRTSLPSKIHAEKTNDKSDTSNCLVTDSEKKVPKVVQHGQTIPSISKEKRSLNSSLFPASPLPKIGVDNTQLRRGEAPTILSSASPSFKMHSAKTNEKSDTSTCLLTDSNVEISNLVQHGETIPLEKRPSNPSLFAASPLQKISVNDPRLRKGRVSSILSSTSPSQTKVHKPGSENLSVFVPSNKSIKVVSGLKEIDMFQSENPENSDEDLDEKRKVRKPGIGVTNEKALEFVGSHRSSKVPTPVVVPELVDIDTFQSKNPAEGLNELPKVRKPSSEVTNKIVSEYVCSNRSSKESTPVGISGLGNNNLPSKNSQTNLKFKSESEKLNHELLPSVAKQLLPRKTVQLRNAVKRLHDSGEPTISGDESMNMSTNCKENVPSNYLPGVVEKRVLIPATYSSLSSVVKPMNMLSKCEKFVLTDKKGEKQAMISTTNRCMPSEVLFKIFKYLPLLDRKNAKLVCKFWCDVCNFEYFLDRQKFICCGIYPTELILQMLTCSSCTYLNLEFFRVNFCFTSTEYWELLGPKIHALHFIDCEMKEEMVKEIIVKCVELRHLTISFERPLLLLQSLLANVCKQLIKRPKLVSIDMRVVNLNGWFSNAILWDLFSIYTNIRKFKFTCHSLGSVASTDFRSCKLLSISPLLKYFLASPNSLEKLDLDMYTKGVIQSVSVWPLIIPQLMKERSVTRLREIVIDINLNKLMSSVVTKFCTAQTELEKFSCTIEERTTSFASSFLSKILDKCPRLRHLNIVHKSVFIINYELFRKWVRSKLVSLSIETYRSGHLSFPIGDEVNWPTNEHLKSLTLSQGLENDLKELFLVTFCSLTFLEMSVLSDDLLRLIWNFQTNLVKLKLVGLEECTIDAFCELPDNELTSNGICNLRNLKYLSLITERMKNKFCSQPKFQLPSLKYLFIGIKQPTINLQNDLLNATENLTELEGVSISGLEMKRFRWLELNRNWKKLRYLRIIDVKSSRFKVKEYMNYFSMSPDLRVFIHKMSSRQIEAYYYDVFHGKVICKSMSSKWLDPIKYQTYGFDSEEFDDSLFKWLLI